MRKNSSRTSHANLYEQALTFTSTLSNQEFLKLKGKLQKHARANNPEALKEAKQQKMSVKEKRKHKDYESGEEAKNALSIFLSWKHSKYGIDDVRLSSARGYLQTTKPCFCTMPPFDGNYIGIDSGAKQGHFHTISLNGVYSKDKRYPYQLWDALKKFSVLEVEQ